MSITSTEYRRSMEWLLASSLQPFIAELAKATTIHPLGTDMPKNVSFGSAPERIHLDIMHPTMRWQHWCREVGHAQSAGCPVFVELDSQSGLWLTFASQETWDSDYEGLCCYECGGSGATLREDHVGEILPLHDACWRCLYRQ